MTPSDPPAEYVPILKPFDREARLGGPGPRGQGLLEERLAKEGLAKDRRLPGSGDAPDRHPGIAE